MHTNHTQCVYGIGRALLLVSEHYSPDPPCAWREGPSTEEASQTASQEESEMDAVGRLKQHSTLSVVMRKEEASKAEVHVSATIHNLYMCSHAQVPTCYPYF